MAVELAKEDNLAEGSLSISGVLKSIKDLFDGNDIFGLLIDCLPDNSVGSFAKFLKYLKFVEDVWLNFFRHCSLYIVKYNKPIYKSI